MTPAEAGFLLLTSQLGDPNRKPLTQAGLRRLAGRVRASQYSGEVRDLVPGDLVAMGYGKTEAEHIVRLLEEEELLEYYISKGRRGGCVPLARVGQGYPALVRHRLSEDSPGCLWAKGDLSLLEYRAVALVGSRDLLPENSRFAREAGLQAARQGFVLVSGNARGADRTAQEACLEAGGSVISVVADCLAEHRERQRVLYLSEACFDGEFSARRALSRNRIIHCMGQLTLVAQVTMGKGGTWDGAVRNLRNRWSPLFCFDDGSLAVDALWEQGAERIPLCALEDLETLCL